MAKNTKHSMTKKPLPNNKKPLLGVETEISLNQKVGLIIGIVCVFLVGVVWAAVLLTSILPTAPKTISPEQAWNDFKANYGQNWQIEWKEATMTPIRLIGGSVDINKINPNVTSVSKDNIDTVVKKFLDDNQSLLKVNVNDLKVIQVFDDPVVGEMGNIITIHYQQYYKDLPVYRSHIIISFSNNDLKIYDAIYYPNLALQALDPKYTLKESAEAAKMAEINRLYPPDQSPYLNQSFDSSIGKKLDLNSSSLDQIPKVNFEDLKIQEKQSLIIYPLESEFQINFTVAYKIDFDLIDKPDFLSQPTYYVDALNENQALARIENIRFANLDGTVTGLQYPYYPVCAYNQDPAFCTQGGSQVSQLQNEEVTAAGNSANTNVSGYYLISGLSGTVNLSSGLSGSYVNVNNLTQADASHTASVTVPATHNWDWQTGGDNSYKKEESNVFFHVNKIHNYFTKGSPFDINLSISANVERDCYCDASTNPATMIISFCKSGSGCEATSLGSDVIYHEYTHIVTNQINSDLDYIGEPGAMDEGYSDYFAATNVNRSTIGDGIWYQPIRDINNTKRYPDDISNDVHKDSVIFSGSLWDLRKILGATIADAMVISTEKSLPDNFREFLEDLISLYPSYTSQICDAFYSNHGIYSNLCIHQTTTGPIAYIGSPASLAEIQKNPTSLNIIGTAVKSKNGTFQNFKIEYALTNTPNNWVNTGVTLTGNGLVEVSENTLGSINLTNLFGYYRIRITVKDSIGEQKYFVSVNIGARTGFPVIAKKPNNNPEWYISPTIVAELDGNTANGLEIIAVSYSGTSGRTNVWHQDGSLVWQQPSGNYSYSHPTVADINLDGNSEIIILDCSQLDILNKNGSVFGSWPMAVPKNSSDPWCHYGSPVAANLDGNTANGLEIVFGADDGKVYAYHYNKTPVSGWPKQTGGRILSTPAVADLDNNPANGLEVVASSTNGKVYIWKADGTDYRPGIWPKSAAGPIYSSPVIANLDNNSSNGLEIIATSNNIIYAWHADSGDYVFTPKNYDSEYLYFSPVIGNIDNYQQNGLEIAVEGLYETNIVNISGDSISNWPQSTSFFSGCSGSLKKVFNNSPSLAEIDGDGRQEIIVSNIADAYPTKPRIFAFNDDGTLVSGFPLILNEYNSVDYSYDGIPTISDLDNDGKSEFIFTGINYSNSVAKAVVHVFDMPWTYIPNNLEAPTFHFDDQRTGKYPKQCSDGTLYGQCNANRQYCNNGNLVNNCYYCGCASGCCERTNNQCSNTCIDGTPFRSCSTNIPKYCGLQDQNFCYLFDACPACGCPDVHDANGTPKYYCKTNKGSMAGECVENPNYCGSKPVINLTFDEGGNNTTTNDQTCYHNNGQLGDGACTPGSGSCPSWVSGHGSTGYALSYDSSDDYVKVVDDDNSLDLKDGFNISAWIKFNSSLTHQFGTIVKKEDAYMLRFYRTTNTKLEGVVYKSNGDIVSLVSNQSSWVNDQWYHVAFTYDKHNLKLFVNEVQNGPSQPLTSNIQQTGNFLSVGNGHTLGYGWNEGFPGVIDNVRIFQTAETGEAFPAQAVL